MIFSYLLTLSSLVTSYYESTRRITDMKGPHRKIYYDMNPWYQTNLAEGSLDWPKQVEEVDQLLSNYIDQLMKDHNYEGLLDVGCGGGGFSIDISKKHQNLLVDAFDYSTLAIESAQKRGSDVLFYQGDATAANVYKKNYDLVVSKNVLHCLIGDDREKFLTNVRNILTKDGRFLLSTHYGLHPEHKKFGVDPITRINSDHTRIFFEANQIMQELNGADFKILDHVFFKEHLAIVFVLKKL